jgi:uncharacterized protein (UPF0335 family)
MTDTPATPGGNAMAILKATVERLEGLEGEIRGLNDDKRDVYAEAKGQGLDVKALKTVLRLRRQDVDERREQDQVVETYMHALGMTV